MDRSRLLLRHGPADHSSNDLLLWTQTTHGERWRALGALDFTRRAIYPDEWLRPIPRRGQQGTLDHSRRDPGRSHLIHQPRSRAYCHPRSVPILASTRQVQNSRLRLQLPRPIVPEAFVALSLSNLPENSHGGNQLLSTDFIALNELLLPEKHDVLLTGGPERERAR